MKSILLFTLAPALAFGGTQVNLASDWTSNEGRDFLSTATTEQIIAASATVVKNAVATAPTERDIYVAVRKDGAAGSGTASDPYDGSTEAKFDAILAGLMNVDQSIHTNLHLAAGTYIVTPVQQVATSTNPGAYCANIPANLTIEGKSEKGTIIQAGIVGNPNATYWVLYNIGDAGGVTFKNMTVDCNAQNQTAANITIDGIAYLNFGGPSTTSGAEYVHMINGGSAPGATPNSEWFGMNITDFGATAQAVISHCAIDHFQGNGACTALAATTMISYNSVTLNNNDCYNFAGKPGGGGGGYQNAYGPSGRVVHNVCHDCTFGIYADVGSINGEIFENNWFDALYQDICIICHGQVVNNMTISNNVFLETYGPALTIGAPDSTQAAGNLISGNRFVLNYQGNSDKRLVVLNYASDTSIINNVVQTTDAGMGQYVAGSTTNSDLSSIVWKNNHYRSGLVIPALAGMSTN